MRVEEVAEILRTKGGYLHFELNGEYYVIQSLSGLYRAGDTVILTLCKTDLYNDVATLWDYFNFKLSDFNMCHVLLYANNMMYAFPSEITIKDDNFHNTVYTAKLKPKDVHFIIDEVKGEGANYNVVLDVRTK